MFALAFRFPVGRYHATPWGRNVNEADVAWPPEPWRLLRALIAVWWRKGDHARWSEDDLAHLIDKLAETLPEYSLPAGVIHAHTRHYMPTGGLNKGRPKTMLIFDAFVRMPRDTTLVAAWPHLTLAPEPFALAADMAYAMGYLGRAESWTQCEAFGSAADLMCSIGDPGAIQNATESEALAKWSNTVNCQPLEEQADGDPVRLLAPLSPSAYSAERQRIMDQAKDKILASAKLPLADRKLAKELEKEFCSRGRKAHTLPERLVDALALDTSDYQDRGWRRPPAARDVVYSRAPAAAFGVVPRRSARRRLSRTKGKLPTVARFLLAGRPLPRIEDAVRIGELMRRAALAQFGWWQDEATGRWIPKAPWEISGRDADGKPLKVPSHTHAFWLPEDTDGDGWVDHVSVYIAGGINGDLCAKLDRITRLWLPPKQQQDNDVAEPGAVKEWRLALEGFGKPADFAGSANIFAKSRRWRSTMPFLASGHLKMPRRPSRSRRLEAYRREVRRLLERRGLNATDMRVEELETIDIGGTRRRAIHFHRFRSRGREAQPDTAGALLSILLPEAIQGPLAIGYGSHFGLGLFVAVSEPPGG